MDLLKKVIRTTAGHSDIDPEVLRGMIKEEKNREEEIKKEKGEGDKVAVAGILVIRAEIMNREDQIDREKEKEKGEVDKVTVVEILVIEGL